MLLFLGIILGIKAMDYHPLTHTDDSDSVKCELCLFSQLNEAISYDGVTSFSVSPFLWGEPYRQAPDFLKAITTEEFSYATLFSRPPPYLS